MSEMVERVARAIADNIQAALPDGVVVDYHYAARAAIEAMRRPTEAMVDAGYDFTADPCWREDFIKGWQAMIDEALK